MVEVVPDSVEVIKEVAVDIALVSAVTFGITGLVKKIFKRYKISSVWTPVFAMVLGTVLWVYANDWSLAPEVVIQGLALSGTLTGAISEIKK